MPFDVMLIVLFAAMLHAAWNALIKSGADKLLDAVMLCAATEYRGLARAGKFVQRRQRAMDGFVL